LGLASHRGRTEFILSLPSGVAEGTAK